MRTTEQIGRRRSSGRVNICTHKDRDVSQTPSGNREVLEDREDLIQQIARTFADIYTSVPPVDKEDESLDPKSYTEFVLQIADRDRWFWSGRHDEPRAQDIYNRLRVSSRVESVGITNIRSTFLLRISTFKARKVNSKWRNRRTKYDLGSSVERAWTAAKELGIDYPAKLARILDAILQRDLGRPSDEQREKLENRILSLSRSWLATGNQPRSVDTPNRFSWEEVLGPYRDRRTSSKRKTRRFKIPHMDLRPPQIEAFKQRLTDADTTYSAALSAYLEGMSGSISGGTGSENSGQQSGGSEKNGQLSEDEWAWSPNDLRCVTCDNRTREALFEHVPVTRKDDIVLRFMVFRLWSDWYDEHSNLPVLPNDALLWIGGGGFETGEAVIEYLKQYLDLDILPHIPNRRCRLIRKDGLPHELYKIVNDDLETPAANYENRVQILSGKPYAPKKVTKRRDEIADELLEERHKTPSIGAQKTFELLNFGCGKDLRSTNVTAKMKTHIEEAYQFVRRMDIEPNIRKEDDESWYEWWIRRDQVAEKERRKYFLALSAIEDQHHPFYTFSSTGRTDRVFGFNRSVLDLPKPVRAILCQELIEVDLKSAHLLIAAWLWDADDAMEKLADDGYSIWSDLMLHYEKLFHANGYEVPEPGDDLYKTVKAALKVAVYSAVYGKHAPSIQAKVTRDLSDILGDEAGEHFRGHPVIAELLEKRDEKLEAWDDLVREKGSHIVYGPTGVEITMDTTIEVNKDRDEAKKGVDARSAMATLAQSYEQSAMQVILEMERDREQSKSRNRFKVALWLHDGAYIKCRSKRARRKNLNRRLEERCKKLAAFAGKDTPMPAFFEFDEIDPPELPEPDTEDNSCQNAQKDPTSNSDSSTTDQAEKKSPSTELKTQTRTTESPSAGSAETGSKEMFTSPDSAEPIDGADTKSETPEDGSVPKSPSAEAYNDRDLELTTMPGFYEPDLDF